MAELELQTVAVAVGIGNDRRKTGVPLRPDPDVSDLLTVDHHIARVVFLCHGTRKHGVPVFLVHDYVDGDQLILIKQLCFVGHIYACSAKRLGDLLGQSDRHNTNQYSHGYDRNYDLVYMLM